MTDPCHGCNRGFLPRPQQQQQAKKFQHTAHTARWRTREHHRLHRVPERLVFKLHRLHHKEVLAALQREPLAKAHGQRKSVCQAVFTLPQPEPAQRSCFSHSARPSATPHTSTLLGKAHSFSSPSVAPDSLANSFICFTSPRKATRSAAARSSRSPPPPLPPRDGQPRNFSIAITECSKQFTAHNTRPAQT